jgi:murein DD-endopeptidase MepM/ murein hydrolase activator NlpD
MSTVARRGWRRDAGIFAAGAGCGLLGGAFLVAAIVWQFGNVIGSRSAATETPPPAIARWDGGTEPAWTPVVEPEHGMRATVPGTTIEPLDAAAIPRAGRLPAKEPTIAPPADSPEELAERSLLIPVEGVSADALTRQFSDPRSGSREHEAIDILAPRNTPVRAVEAGTIARLFLSKAGGITIYQFDPTQRYCYYYAHLERYADGLREGAAVKKGDVLGFVGTSGNAPANTPHLHFAIFRLTDEKRWWEGTPLDPYDVLKR